MSEERERERSGEILNSDSWITLHAVGSTHIFKRLIIDKYAKNNIYYKTKFLLHKWNF